MQDLQGEMTGKGVIWLVVNSSSPSSPSHRTPGEKRMGGSKDEGHGMD
jgi:hypothetical protein